MTQNARLCRIVTFFEGVSLQKSLQFLALKPFGVLPKIADRRSFVTDAVPTIAEGVHRSLRADVFLGFSSGCM